MRHKEQPPEPWSGALAECQRRILESQRHESLGRLAAGVAHDFNNLLLVIAGSTAFVRHKLVDASAVACELDAIDKAVQTASTLASRLLYFNRSRDDERTGADVETVLSELEPLLRRLIETRTDLRIDVEHDLPPVAVTAGQLEQIVMNLVVNARDVLPSGGHIWIGASRSSGGVMLTIEDDGPGIAPALHREIFKPFWTTKPPESGTGLGLTIVTDILTQSGGSIDVESDAGSGTRFVLSLPTERGA
jgi:signal transduction histidine kinase